MNVVRVDGLSNKVNASFPLATPPVFPLPSTTIPDSSRDMLKSTFSTELL